MNNFYTKVILTIFLMAGMLLSAQALPERNKIKALKIAFITERLSLSSSEAEVFWPIYNRFEEKREALRDRQRAEVFDKIGNVGNMPEAESKALLKKYLEIEEEEEEIDKEFYTKLADAISAKKTLLLFGAEHEFRKRLFREMRQRQGGRGN